MKIAMIGGGQLAMFLGAAAKKYGHECLAITDQPSPPASKNCVMIAMQDKVALHDALSSADIVTFESENIPAELHAVLAVHERLSPSFQVMTTCSDRLLEKQFIQEQGVPTAVFHPVNDLSDYDRIAQQIGYRGILKSRRGGYDGRGQLPVTAKASAEAQGIIAVGAIIEEYVDFTAEVSILSGRSRHGDFYHFPLCKNYHQGGILIRTDAPYQQPSLQAQAENAAEKILQSLNYVGLAAIEFFVKGDSLIVNEIAPRVHNSGHWTLDAANVSQFDCHIAMITGESLPPLTIKQPATMINCIGVAPRDGAVPQLPGMFVYDYHKEPRPMRKCGHITLLGDRAALEPNVQALLAKFSSQPAMLVS